MASRLAALLTLSVISSLLWIGCAAVEAKNDFEQVLQRRARRQLGMGDPLKFSEKAGNVKGIIKDLVDNSTSSKNVEKFRNDNDTESNVSAIINNASNAGVAVQKRTDSLTVETTFQSTTERKTLTLPSSDTSTMETARCSKEIALTQCKSVLSPFYNTTRVDKQLQATMGRHLTTDLLTRFDNCSSSARLFLCGSELPGCQNNGLPILPCKHTCTQFSQECKSQLQYSGVMFNCDHFPDASLYPHAQCMYAPDIPLPRPSPHVNTSQCQNLKNQWCLQLGYNMTRIPNLLSLVSQGQSEVYLDIFESLMSMNVRCHEALQLFSCSVLAPSCNNRQPCQELCIQVTEQCDYLLQTVGFPLSLNCSVFPNYVKDEDKCIIHDTVIPQRTTSNFTCAPGFYVPMRVRCDTRFDCNNGADEHHCAPNECANNEFFCRSNGDCIPRHWECDNYTDCSGGEDELNCAGCPESQLMCSDNHTCYTLDQRCDLYPHCRDWDDERGCSDVVCNADQFRCHSGLCIPIAYRCDGKRHCPGNVDPEDEKFCVTEDVCDDNEFRCMNGVNGFKEHSRCIPGSWRCDDQPDCTDYSDEHNCTQETVCSGISCENNGTCVDTGQRTFTCQCITGFTGQLCHNVVLANHSCDHPIEIDECRTILPYNTTSTAPHIQMNLSASTKSVLASLNKSACNNLASLFVCSSRFPACQANYSLPLPPCRHVCLNFVEKCRNVLAEDGATDLLDIKCDTYPEYSTNNTFGCLSGTDQPKSGACTGVVHSIQLQAEYQFDCTSLTSIAYSIIDASLLQHTKNLQRLCPGCRASHNQTLPVVKCLSNRLVVTWSTDLHQQQPFGDNLMKSLRRALLNYQESLSTSTILRLTILSASPRVVSPMKDKSGLYITPVIKASCVTDGTILSALDKSACRGSIDCGLA